MGKVVLLKDISLPLIRENLNEFVVDKESNFVNHSSFYVVIFRGDMLFFDYQNQQLLDNFIERHRNELGDFVREYKFKKQKDAKDDFDKFVCWVGWKIPYLITGCIANGREIWINKNENYDVLNSKELQQLVKQFNDMTFYFDGKPLNTNEIVNTKGDKVATTWYHGTRCQDALYILKKGLRPTPQNSPFPIQHDKTVFLTSDYKQSKWYATYKQHFNPFNSNTSPWQTYPCVIEIDGEKLNPNKFVYDYDVYNSHMANRNDSVYNDRMRERDITYDSKSNVIQKDTDPRKYKKVGYRGVIMPNAIKSIIVIANRLERKMPVEEFIKLMEENHVVAENVECDVYEIGQESDNPPIGGNYAHVEEKTDENLQMFSKKEINEYIKNKDINFLNESQESKSISAAKKLAMQKLNYNEQQADEFIRVKLRNDLPSLRTPQGGKFIFGVTRMFCDGQLGTANDRNNLNSTLKLVASDAHINEYDRNLNGLSAQELTQRFAKAMSNNLEAERNEINAMEFTTPSDYEIVRINGFEEAQKFGKYTSWCVTHDKRMFDSYTSKGINQFYFCLKQGFENVKAQPSDNCPLDEYGLSMLAVCVNENGMLSTCTCRWNHDNGGDDSIMNTKEVSQVIGMNFFEVFKPNNKWNDLLKHVVQLLKQGEKLENIFNSVGDFHEGFARVVLNEKYNFITSKGKFLSAQWFDYVDDFHEGFASVDLNGKCNFITTEGKILSSQWFDAVDEFHGGFARVRLNKKYNFITSKGKFLSAQWFDYVDDFHEGFARVKSNGRFNFITTEGEILSSQWLDVVDDFYEGFARVKSNGKCNFITSKGKFLSAQWFDAVDEFHGGFARVVLNGKCNFITTEGKILSSQWFDYVDDFHEGFASVELNRKDYELDTKGNLFLQESIDKLNENFGFEGNMNQFKQWFGKSVLVDENGEPIKMYHGTDQTFDTFSKEHIGRYGSYEGYGFNFTPFSSRAASYNSKNIIEAYLRAENPMTTKSHKITLNQLIEIIKEIDKGKPFTDTIVAAYEPARYGENWDEKYYRRALPIAAKTIYQYNKENDYGDAGLYSELSLNGNGEVNKVIETFEKMGYDSVIHYDNTDRIDTVIVFEPNQIKLVGNKTYNNDSNLMGENFDFEVDSSEIDLSSFKKQNELAPIWDNNGILDSKIRLKLLDIADDFWEFVNLTWVKPNGIILTGSICNFNWSSFSDIDLHLIVDFDEIDEKTEFVKEYLDAKKNEWNGEHEDLKILGYQVELYVQNLDEMPQSGGIYDLEENKWLKKPSPNDIKSIGLDKFSIKDKAARIMTIIDDMYDALSSTNDAHKIEEIGEDAKYLWKKIKSMRKHSLEERGESGIGNICYKYMRRVGYLDKLWKLRTICYDKTNSITESKKASKKKYNVYIDGKKDESFSDMNWKRKPNVGKGFYYGGAVFKIKKVTDDSIYAIEESNKKCSIVLKENTKFNVDLFALAKKRFGITQDIRECGYILPSGEMLDFSGRHEISRPSDATHLNGRRGLDHRGIYEIGWNMEKDTKLFDVSMEDFIRQGAVRISASQGWSTINLYVKPTKEQTDVISRLIRYAHGNVTVEIGDGNDSLSYAEYDNVKPSRVIGEINRFFDEGINLMGNVSETRNFFKNKTIKEYITYLKNSFVNEEIVADGSANHNPYQKRWKAERKALKDFICNFGKIMTSRENGKQYKCFYDKVLSQLIGFNYCICLQWDPINLKPSSTLYIRALDKFTDRIFQAQYDDRGRDNIRGTYDDLTLNKNYGNT